jgi:uncharacterized protein (TIGR03067 family)
LSKTPIRFSPQAAIPGGIVMIAKSLWLAPVLLLAALAQPADDGKSKKDLDMMQGTWIMHALEINGKDSNAIDNTFLIVKKDEYRTKVKDREVPGFRLVLDPSKDPKWIDMIKTETDGTEQVYKGIYSLEKGVFKVCRGVVATQERPSQFATWPDTGYFVVTWKKQAK